MSNETNYQLFERAADMLEEWDGTIIAETIQLDLDRDDLEALHTHVSKAEAMLAQEDFESSDVY